MADAGDLKSSAREGVRVRVPPPAPAKCIRGGPLALILSCPCYTSAARSTKPQLPALDLRRVFAFHLPRFCMLGCGHTSTESADGLRARIRQLLAQHVATTYRCLAVANGADVNHESVLTPIDTRLPQSGRMWWHRIPVPPYRRWTRITAT
jgi:hypothetical protein